MASRAIAVGNYVDGGYKVVIVASLLIMMQLLMVGGRLFSRKLQKVWLGVDDYVLVSATVSILAFLVTDQKLIGVGHHNHSLRACNRVT